MKLIISTDGTARPSQHDMSSVPLVAVNPAEDIGKVTTVDGPPTYGRRDVVYVELKPEQALGIALDILTRLSLDLGTVASWNISFPEPELDREPHDNVHYNR